MDLDLDLDPYRDLDLDLGADLDLDNIFLNKKSQCAHLQLYSNSF